MNQRYGNWGSQDDILEMQRQQQLLALQRAQQELAMSQSPTGGSDQHILDQISFVSEHPVDTRTRRRGDRSHRAAGDIAALTAGIGTMTQGISSLIWGGRQSQYQPAPNTQNQQAPAAAPFPTGPVLLGVGAIVMLGMLGLAASQSGGGRRSRRL